MFTVLAPTMKGKQILHPSRDIAPHLEKKCGLWEQIYAVAEGPLFLKDGL